MREKKHQEFPLFAVLWPLASQLHLLSLGEQGSSWMGMILWGLGALCMMMPAQGWLLALLCGAQCVEVFVRLPWVANHWLFFSWVNLVLLVGLWRYRRGESRTWVLSGEDWSAVLDSVRKPICMGMALLYGMALFHKLNSGFWDPLESCAVALWESVPQLPLLDLDGDLWLRRTLIAGSLGLETLVPLLLLWTRGRWIGILIGAGFHMALGFVPYETYYNFSALMMALYVLILPRPANRWLQERLSQLQARGGCWGRRAWIAGVGGLSLYLMWDSRDFVEGLYWTDFGVVFFMGLGPLLWVLLAWSLWGALRRVDGETLLDGIWKGWWVLLIGLGVNAVGPYIGWKSELSFSMYSNLRVRDGQSNHWVIPRTLDLWGWQSDWVSIRSASSRRLRSIQGNGQDMTWLEFRDHLARDCDEGARFTRGGKRYRRDPGDVSPPFSTPLRWWVRKVVRFRPVDRGPVQSCVH